MIIFSSYARFSFFTNHLHCLFYYGFSNENVSPLKISVFWVLFEILKPCSCNFSCITNFRNAKRRIIPPPTKRVYSLIEFLLDSAKRQNYAVCMCVCRFYIYLPPLSSLSYIHKPTNSDLYYHRIHLYSRDSVNLSDPPWKIAYFNHLRTCLTAILIHYDNRVFVPLPMSWQPWVSKRLRAFFLPLCRAGRWHRLPWSLPHGIPTGHIHIRVLSHILCKVKPFSACPFQLFKGLWSLVRYFDIGNTFNNVPLRESQMLLAADDAGSLGVAKTFIESKIYNCRWVI